MGGVADALVNAGKDLFENFASKGAREDVAAMWSKLRPMQNEGLKSEAGKDLLEVTKNYIQGYQVNLEAGVREAAKLPPDLRPHPLELKSQARNRARAQFFGQNDSVGAYLLHHAERSPNMTPVQAHLHTQAMADNISSILRDTIEKHEYDFQKGDAQKIKDLRSTIALVKTKNDPQSQQYAEQLQKQLDDLFKSRTINTRQVSSFKYNVSRNKETPVKNPKTGKVLDVGPTYSTKFNKLETHLNNWANTVVYPFVVLPHLGTIFNTTLTTPIKDLTAEMFETIKAAPGSNPSQRLDYFLQHSGLFANTSFDIYSANWYGSRGLMSKYFGSRVGTIAYKATHAPLFDAARNWQLARTGAMGYHTLLDMTDRIMKNPIDKRAILELKEMGIDYRNILNRKGELTDDDIRKALWRFTDNKIFLDTTLGRSFYARHNFATRIGLMYHGYVSRQGQLIAKDFMKLVNSNDYVGLAQYITALCVAFPLVGMLTKDITMIARGDWDDVHVGKDFQDLKGDNGGRAFLTQVAEDFGHTAGYGIATSYIRGASRHSLANMAVGPIGNVAARIGEDSISPAYKELWQGKEVKGDDYKPILRDAIEYNPFAYDNLGKLFVHKFLPTKREEALRNPKPSFRFKSKIKRPSFKNQ